MALNDTVTQESAGVADAGDHIIDGSASSTGAWRVVELGGSGGCDVYREADPDGDGTYEISDIIAQPGSQWSSQGNDLRVSSDDNIRLRINNTSGSSQAFYAVGYEVDS